VGWGLDGVGVEREGGVSRMRMAMVMMVGLHARELEVQKRIPDAINSMYRGTCIYR